MSSLFSFPPTSLLLSATSQLISSIHAFAFVPSAPPRLSSYVHNPRRRLRRRYAPTIAYASPATTTPLQIFPHAYRADRLHRHRPHEFISFQRSRSEFNAASPPSCTPAFSPSSSAFRRLQCCTLPPFAVRKLRCVVVILPSFLLYLPCAHITNHSAPHLERV